MMSILNLLSLSSGDTARLACSTDTAEQVCRRERINALVVGSETGFSPLGKSLGWLSEDLHVARSELEHCADWVRFKNPDVGFVAINSRNAEGLLQGMVLAATETSISYERALASGMTSSEFHFLLTRAIFGYLRRAWAARSFAISHLTASQRFRSDCALQAARAFLAEHLTGGTLVFWGCCITERHLQAVRRLRQWQNATGPVEPPVLTLQGRPGGIVIGKLNPQPPAYRLPVSLTGSLQEMGVRQASFRALESLDAAAATEGDAT